jgi:chromosome segregation ATPase
MKARWEASEGKVVAYRKNIRDMKVQLDAMSGAKYAIAEHKTVQEPRLMQKRLDAQYSAMAGPDRILPEIRTRKSELDDQVGRQNTRIEECEREIGLLRSAKASMEGRIAKMEQRRRSVEGGWPALVTLMQSAEGNAEKDPRGYRLGEPMRALVASLSWSRRPSGRAPWCLWVCRLGRPGTVSSTLFPIGWG